MKVLLVVVVIIILFTGCAPVSAQRLHPVVTGGVAGASLGAAIGALTGNPGKGAAIGAIAGSILGATTGSTHARTSMGGRYGRYGNLDEYCDSMSNDIDRQACLEGVTEGERVRARRIENTCRQIGRDYGYRGYGMPGSDVSDRFDKEAYRKACEGGLAEGYASGESRRANMIRARARSLVSRGY